MQRTMEKVSEGLSFQIASAALSYLLNLLSMTMMPLHSEQIKETSLARHQVRKIGDQESCISLRLSSFNCPIRLCWSWHYAYIHLSRGLACQANSNLILRRTTCRANTCRFFVLCLVTFIQCYEQFEAPSIYLAHLTNKLLRMFYYFFYKKKQRTKC